MKQEIKEKPQNQAKQRQQPIEFEVNRDLYDHSDKHESKFIAKAGINADIVKMISKSKTEPEWMKNKRLQALTLFNKTETPTWGPDLSKLDLQKIVYYIEPNAKETTSWKEVPEEIRKTFDRLGIPEAEKQALSGVGAQYDSTVVYHNIQESLKKKGVIFENMDVAVQQYPELVQKYFMTSCIPISDHKFIMLHGAVWSGGTFIYVPKNVHVDLPLQAYFRMNAQKGGQFEHTLIIIDEGASLHYIEGCSSPRYQENSLHAGCVEIHVAKNAHMRYTSIENWSRNVYNLNTKRAIVQESATMIWVNGNMGSAKTMLYPCSILVGEHARTESIGIAYAGKNQEQDTGTKVIHAAPNTSSFIQSKSISKDGGVSTYRGIVRINSNAKGSISKVQCDGLMMDRESTSNTIPAIRALTPHTEVSHEATVGRITPEHLFYLKSRGLTEQEATKMIVSGFIEPITKALPLEYAIELNKLIELEIEGL